MKVYKVETCHERLSFKTFILGAVKLPYKEVECIINDQASNGWFLLCVWILTSLD